MADEGHEGPKVRWEVVPHADGPGAGARHPVVLAGDAALGVAASLARVGVRAATFGVGVGVGAVRFAESLPGVRAAADAAGQALRPLADDGRRVRGDAGGALVATTQRTIEGVAPVVVDALDIDGILARVDIDAVVGRIDIDALVARIDLDRVIGGVDVDAIVDRLDLDAIMDRVDVNEVVQRVDMDAIVEQTELGSIVARSTSGIATETLDVARTQAVGVDDVVARVVNRIMRRRATELPAGPERLVGPGDAEPAQPPPPGEEPGP